jgi:hypothetical protein
MLDYHNQFVSKLMTDQIFYFQQLVLSNVLVQKARSGLLAWVKPMCTLVHYFQALARW